MPQWPKEGRGGQGGTGGAYCCRVKVIYDHNCVIILVKAVVIKLQPVFQSIESSLAPTGALYVIVPYFTYSNFLNFHSAH